MFTFTPAVPANLHKFLAAVLQPWIDRKDHSRFRLDTIRYGLVSFERTPWPLQPHDETMVGPAGEQDLAALQAFSAVF